MKWIVILLVALNITLLATVWFGYKRQTHAPPRPDMRQSPAGMLITGLGFKDQQLKDFENLKSEHRNEVDDLLKDGKRLREQLFDLLKMGDKDMLSAEAYADSIGWNQKAIEMATYRHFVKVRQMCSETQKQRFDEIIKDVMREMAKPRREPHHEMKHP